MPTIALLAICTLAAPDVEPPTFFAANEELRAYLLEAGENNPALQARHAEWLAALERIPQVTSLDDPMLTYGQFLQSDVNRVKLGLKQKFPSFGTLRARGDKAGADADATLARFHEARNRVFAEVKRAYFEYAYLGKSIEVTESQTEILGYMEEVARTKYALAMASEEDLLRVHIEQAKLQDRLDGLSQYRPALAARLNAALGRDVSQEIPWPQETEFPPPPPPIADVLARVRTANPDLTAFDHVIASRQKQAELARKQGHPDFTLGLEYGSISGPRQIRPDRPYPASLHGARRLLTGTTSDAAGTLIDLYAVANYDEPMSYRSGGDDNVMVSLSVNVPLWRRRIKGGIEEATLLGKAALLDKCRKRLALETAARQAVFATNDARRRHGLYTDTLIPQARQTYESIQGAYAAALGSGFLDLLNSVRDLLDFQLEAYRAATDLQLAAAELEYLMAGPWNSRPLKEDEP